MVKIETTLTLNFEPDKAGAITVSYDEEHAVMKMRQGEDAIWVPYSDVSAFVEAVRKWFEEDQ